LQKYDTILGFFAGNEAMNLPSTTSAAEFVKAAVRDTKVYIEAKNYRPLRVGYAANGVPDIYLNVAAYLNCGDDQGSLINF